MPWALPLAFPEIALPIGLILLALVILPQTRDSVVGFLSSLGSVLSWTATPYKNFVDGLISTLSQWLDQAAGPVASLILNPVQRVVAVFGEVAHTQADTITAVNNAPSQAINYVQANDLPPIYNQIGATQSEVSSLQDWSTLEFGQAFNEISANHTETRSWVDNLSQNVQAFNDWVIGQLQAHSATEANNHAESRSWVDALAAQVQAFNAWTVQQLQSQAASIGYVESEANQWAAAAQTNAEGYADVAATAAETAAVGFVTSTVVPQVNATAAALTSYLDTCGTPLCGGMLNSANLLNELKNIVGTGAMLLFVAEAIDRPVETAQAVDALVGPLAHTVYAGIRDVTGL